MKSSNKTDANRGCHTEITRVTASDYKHIKL